MYILYKDVQFFDYSLEYKNPYRDGDWWIYPIKIKITSNKNLSKFYNGLYDLVEDISISYETKRYREDLNLGTHEMNYAKLTKKTMLLLFLQSLVATEEINLRGII